MADLGRDPRGIRHGLDGQEVQPVQDLLSGRRSLRPNNDNQALFQNALELAMGGTEAGLWGAGSSERNTGLAGLRRLRLAMMDPLYSAA